MINKTKEIALISGMHGFIGQHLAKALRERDIEPVAIPRELLDSISSLDEFFLEHKPQYIYALHAYGNHGKQLSYWDEEVVNYDLTRNLLEVTTASAINLKAFINFSTSSIYGHQLLAMNENLTAIKPDTFYAASKAGAMYLARAYAKQYDKPIVSVIPFSVFGEGEADWRFIPTICKHLVTGKPMPISGNQEQTHDWIHVDNLISGIMKVVANADKLKGEWINIGMGEKQTNREVRETLEKIAGKKLRLDIGGFKEQPHHSDLWISDNRKLLSLGWEPSVTLEEGLKRCWEYYKEKYGRKT